MNKIFLCLLTLSAVGVFMMLIMNNIDYSVHTSGQKCLPSCSSRENHQHYTTSDEMRYILYGDGTEFSVYDPRLLDFIRTHITQPSPTRPRRLTKPLKIDASQMHQSPFVDKLLSRRRDGFFIECGAADGESFSNSLFFERVRNWTGLLIEANPGYYRQLLNKNRRAYVLGSCLSTELRPMTVRMQPAGLLGGITNMMPKSHSNRIIRRPEVAIVCFPLNSIMAALNVSCVDYLSLDVEGPELEILHTIDWSRLRIDVITVEYRILGNSKHGINVTATLSKLRSLREFFKKTHLYREVAVLPHGDDALGLDVAFSRI